MKTTPGNNLITVGKLVKELKGFGEERAHYDLAVWVPEDDERSFCIMGTALDKDGNLCISMEDLDLSEGYYNVQNLLDDLDIYDSKVKVYLEGCGMTLGFDRNGDGCVFGSPDDQEEIAGCYASPFGTYKEEPQGWLTESEKRMLAKEEQKKKRVGRLESIALIVLTLVGAFGLFYNIAALVKHAERPVWESILWIVTCIVVMVICLFTLYYSKDDKK